MAYGLLKCSNPKTYQDVPVDFSARILITNPAIYHLGRGIVFFALIAIAIGCVSFYAGDFLIPAMGWVAGGVPAFITGAILIGCAVRKS